jgi:N-acetyl-anhydromuramyl-L-alanine amidase AmpD
MRHTPRIAAAALAGTLGAVLALPVGAGAQEPTGPQAARQAEFAAAAAEFGVPGSVLLAVSYQESRWEAHRGQPSTTGQYGPMALTLLPDAGNAKGDGPLPAGADTLSTAARLIGAGPASLTTDEKANIRGGAALLASYGRALDHGGLPAGTGGWYAAVAKYSGAGTQDGAARFADDVFGTIEQGASRHTDDGQTLSLAADPGVRPDTAGLSALRLAKGADTQAPECPRELRCNYVPAAYAPDSTTDVTDYGNYDLADRPNDHLTVNYIVVHDTEESYEDTLKGFQNPADYVSAHYVVRGSDGTVTQMVPTKDVAWQAGNWYINAHSVGIEQEGYAVQGATWYTERLYKTTATLVRYLAARYHVKLDRQHILGHENVPATTAAGIPAMHWDPGPFWNWGHFMNLLGSYTVPTGSSHSKVVTINPVFQQNVQTVLDCEKNSTPVTQAASFVWLRTAPSADAPLFNDPGLHQKSPAGTAGTACAADWGDKAGAGQQFAVAGRQGDWVAIWWDGAKVWFQNPKHHQVVTPTSTVVVRPKAGKASIPTYGVAYPEPSEFPADIPVRSIVPLTYTIQAGQSYVYGGVTPTDYYYAMSYDNSLPHDHTDVVGTTKYLEIQLGHRIAFVKASDVDVVPAIG